MKKILATAVGLLVLSTIPTKAANLGGSSDIFLGFDVPATSVTGAYKSVVIDLGTIGNISTNGIININQTATNSLLVTTFGASWWTRTDLNWFAFGGNTTNTMVIAANQANAPLDSGVTAGRIGNSDRSQITQAYGYVNAEQGAATTNSITVGSLKFATSVDNGVGGGAFTVDSFGNEIDGTQSAFNMTFPAQGVALYDGASAVNLDLWNYTPAGSGAVPWNADSTPFASILNINGIISITPVPEPQTYALMMMAGGIIYIARRRFAKSV